MSFRQFTRLPGGGGGGGGNRRSSSEAYHNIDLSKENAEVCKYFAWIQTSFSFLGMAGAGKHGAGSVHDGIGTIGTMSQVDFL